MCAPANYAHIFLCWTPPVWQEWRAKSEIRNPKQIPMSKGASPQNQAAAGGLIGSGFEDLSFEFGACFGFRVSDFVVLAGQRCPAEKMWDMLRLRGEGER